MKVTNCLKKLSFAAVLGLSALLCTGPSLAANSSEDPRVQGIDLDLVFSIDATKISYNEFPLRVTFDSQLVRCMNKWPARRFIDISTPGYYMLSPEKIENRNRGRCFSDGFFSEFRVNFEINKNGLPLQKYGENVLMEQTGFFPPSGKIWFRSAFHKIYLTKVPCAKDGLNCYNRSPVEVDDYDTVYLHVVLE